MKSGRIGWSPADAGFGRRALSSALQSIPPAALSPPELRTLQNRGNSTLRRPRRRLLRTPHRPAAQDQAPDRPARKPRSDSRRRAGRSLTLEGFPIRGHEAQHSSSLEDVLSRGAVELAVDRLRVRVDCAVGQEQRLTNLALG